MLGKIKNRITNKLYILIAAILIIAGSFAIYCSVYYHAEEEAMLALEGNDVVRVISEDKYYIFEPAYEDTSKAIIFYPGGKVEYKAYSPLMLKLSESGYRCYLVKMPFNLAVFGKDFAKGIIEENEDISKWYLAGHSLGGAMAAEFVKDNCDIVSGLILLGAYSTSDISDCKKVLSIYGSEDKIVNIEKIREARDYMPLKYREIYIKGANHSGFGNYGKQSKDGIANMDSDEQQTFTVDYIVNFFNS